MRIPGRNTGDFVVQGKMIQLKITTNIRKINTKNSIQQIVDKQEDKWYIIRESKRGNEAEEKCMLTKFGKELRKLRLDRDERLKEMAEKLGVTVAYLSAVENGKRRVPDSWIKLIENTYDLSEDEILHLQQLAFDERDSISLNIGNMNVFEKNIAYSFARRFQDLSEEDKNDLKKILDRKD